MSRGIDETGGSRGPAYEQRFREIAASGQDVHGEAAFVDGLLAGRPGARILDAGCGTGRVGRELARRGYEVVGVDNDASMLEVARAEAPELSWRLQDLAALADSEEYDLVVAAGNVMVYLAEGTEADVVRRLAAALRPGGRLVAGWATAREGEDGRPALPVAKYDRLTAATGLQPVGRYSTWDGEPLRAGSDWCVAVDRRPE